MKFKGITIGKTNDDKSKVLDEAMAFMSADGTKQEEMLRNSARGALESLAREAALTITVAGTDGSFESLEKAEDFFIENMAKHAVIFKKMSKEELTLEMLMRIMS